MAAGRAAELGASVILIEKNTGLGKKLLITGGGRCNVTNDTPDVRKFLAKLQAKGKFLFSTFSQHSVKDSLAFFNDHGMKTKVENEGRVFPISDSARSVWDVLVRYMKQGNVEVTTGLAAKGFHVRDGLVVGLNTIRGREVSTITADSYILATGGTSLPETGSTGEGFEWLSKIGHTIHEPDAALVPVKISEKWVHALSGIAHQHAKLTLIEIETDLQDKTIKEIRKESRVGRMVFTSFGMSGPLVLNLSKTIREYMSYAAQYVSSSSNKRIEISLDIMSDYDYAALDKKIQESFKANQNKKLKNTLKDLIPPSFCSTIFDLTKLDPEKEVNIVSREERLALGKVLKDMRMTPTGFLGKEKAIVASGGVKLEEVDFKTMRSRLFPNLYLVGDILDIERPSGGYSLQLCWTTGWVAGTHAASRGVSA